MSMLGSITQLTGANVEAQRWLWRALDILESDAEEALELARKATTAFDAAGESDNAADASRLVVELLDKTVSATFSSGDIEGAIGLASEQLEASQQGDTLMQAYAHLMWAELMLALGKSSELKEHASTASQTFEELLGRKLFLLGVFVKPRAAGLEGVLNFGHLQEGDGLEGERLAQQALARWKDLGDKRGVAAWHLLSAARSVSGQGVLLTTNRNVMATALYNLAERQRYEPNGGLTAQRTAEEAEGSRGISMFVCASVGIGGAGCGTGTATATALTAVVKAMVVRGLHADALQLIQDRVEELRGPEKKLGPNGRCYRFWYIEAVTMKRSALVHLGSGGVAALQATEVLAITQEIGNRHEEAWMLKKLSEAQRPDLTLGEDDDEVDFDLRTANTFLEFRNMDETAGDKVSRVPELPPLDHPFEPFLTPEMVSAERRWKREAVTVQGHCRLAEHEAEMLLFGRLVFQLGRMPQTLDTLTFFGHKVLNITCSERDEFSWWKDGSGAPERAQQLAVRSGMKQYSEALVCAQEAQTIFQELGDQSGALALKCQLESEPGSQWFQGEEEAMKSLSQIYTAMAKREAHKAPYRQRALEVLGDFATSVTKMDAEGFEKGLTQLRLYQGVDGQDVAASLWGALEDPDVYKWYIQASAQYFQVSVDEAESMVGRAPLNPMQHAISFDASLAEAASVCLYLAFRLGAMGYGPSFRPIQQAYRQGRPYEAEQGEPPVALGVLRDETAEEWERVALMQAHAGILDGSLQLTALYSSTFTQQFDDFVAYQRQQLKEVQVPSPTRPAEQMGAEQPTAKDLLYAPFLPKISGLDAMRFSQKDGLAIRMDIERYFASCFHPVLRARLFVHDESE
ncbi:hypothetical protein AK812_SmicGene35912 [Symbiodinium microadriaticum]|uniref:Uncharacterized protein n=1 Tax=Symbiodinium microadriaticum TaxID=2951 RepID=A0A1Q9CK77_SYMMI|nr:hypothetical protein AK812_SmicGene35912 [Symbiodinium microadriaticum]